MSRFFAWYNEKLVTRPLLTNMISTGTLFAVGDTCAQSITDKPFDYSRNLRAATYGTLVFGPFCTYWYPLLNKLTSPNPAIQAVKRMGADQLINAPFLGIPAYYTVMGLMEGKSSKQIKETFEKNYLETMRINYTVWPAVQLANFFWVPLHYRLLVVNLVSIGWNTFLSLKNAEKGIEMEDDYVPT